MAFPMKKSTRRGLIKTISLDAEAATLLRAWSAGPRTEGRTLSLLVHEEAARREERSRLRAVIGPLTADPRCPQYLRDAILQCFEERS
jgi:hypothetical protein